MKLKRVLLLCAALTLALGLAGCKSTSNSASTTKNTTSNSLTFNNAKWNYDKTNDVYWRVKVSYCKTPQAPAIETMGIFVPGAYLTGKKNADGTYTCTVNKAGKVGTFTGNSAPIVVPVNTPGYSQSAAPTSYSYNSVSAYMKAGLIYVQPGIRGRASMQGAAQSDESYSGGAPWGATDVKAAIRYYRYNKDALPGNSEKVYTFGMSGGGAQSAVVGSSGDSDLYMPYLKAIGAATTDAKGAALSDKVDGSMCWCPITCLDEADAAYEWNMGQFASSGLRAKTSFGSALSQDLANSYAKYFNKLGLKDGSTTLSLSTSKNGIYQAGSYYDYLKNEVESSLNAFLKNTKFPYKETAQAQFPGGNTGMGNGSKPALPAGAKPNGTPPAGAPTGAMPGASSSTSSKTYKTAQAYIDSLNTKEKWITYDAKTNKATITNLAAFAKYAKTATKSVGAFDQVDRGQGENNLFGNGQSKSYHFDATLAQLLNNNASKYAKLGNWKASYASGAASDLKRKDSLGTSIGTRVAMYNPLYYLNSYYKGYQTSQVAPHWRIRTGAFQSDTALTTETNLALALKNTSAVKDVDFATVWGQKHVMAETSGDSTSNFIAWVKSCNPE